MIDGIFEKKAHELQQEADEYVRSYLLSKKQQRKEMEAEEKLNIEIQR